MKKPRLRKSYLFGWWCEGRGVKLFAETPEQAYNLWEVWIQSSEALKKSLEDLKKKVDKS
jgi:hypothetical protein